MENKENNSISSNKKSYSQINTDIQSSLQGDINNKINPQKNSVIFRNKKVDNSNNKLTDDYDDYLDHPKPLASDFEERDDLRKTLILQEIKENKINSTKLSEKNEVRNLNDEYFKIVNNIGKEQITQNNNQNQKKLVRVNLNEVNNILFKNKFKIRKKDENKNNNSKLSNEEKLIIKVRNTNNQNPFREKESSNKNKINNNNSVKFQYKQIKQNKTNSSEKNIQISSYSIKRNITSPIINKCKPFIKINNNNNNNVTQIQYRLKESKNLTNLTSHKQNSSLNEKNFNNNISNIISEKKRSYILTPKAKITSDVNGVNNRPYLNQIYISENPKNIYLLHRKNKNSSNPSKTEANSSKEKNINIKRDIFNSKEAEGIQKQTYIKGGKFNNIQTTYIISSKKSNLKGIIKVNKNPVLNYKTNNKIQNLTLNNISNINTVNNLYNNYMTQTPSKHDETIGLINSARSKIHICGNNPKKDALQYYVSNTAKNSGKNAKKIILEKNKENLGNNSSLSKNGHNNKYINNYNYKYEKNIKNFKYYNITRSLDMNNIQYYDENNSAINYGTYNNTIDYNAYWNIPQGNNYQVYGINSYSRYYNN